jgi:hypothetical protein
MKLAKFTVLALTLLLSSAVLLGGTVDEYAAKIAGLCSREMHYAYGCSFHACRTSVGNMLPPEM